MAAVGEERGHARRRRQTDRTCEQDRNRKEPGDTLSAAKWRLRLQHPADAGQSRLAPAPSAKAGTRPVARRISAAAMWMRG